MATWRELFTDALLDLGVLAPGEVPTADDLNNCLRAQNRVIDQWAAERLAIYQQLRTTWSIVSGTATYTVGTGGTINVVRPVYVEHVRFQDTSMTPNVEYPGLRMLTDDEWSEIRIKDLTSTLPQAAYYNPTYSTARGTLTLWPVPTSSTLQGVMYSAGPAITEVTDLSSSVSLPPGYRRLIVKGCAVEVAPSYQRQVQPEIKEAYLDALNTVKRANVRMNEMGFPPGALPQGSGGGYYYIRSGS